MLVLLIPSTSENFQAVYYSALFETLTFPSFSRNAKNKQNSIHPGSITYTMLRSEKFQDTRKRVSRKIKNQSKIKRYAENLQISEELLP